MTHRIIIAALALFASAVATAAPRCPTPGAISYSMGAHPSLQSESVVYCPVKGRPLDANLIGPNGCPARGFNSMNFSVDDKKLGIYFVYSCDAHPMGRNPKRVNGENCVDNATYIRGFSIELAGPRKKEYDLTYECWSAAYAVCGPNIRYGGEKRAGEWCGDHFNSQSPWDQWWIIRISIYLRRHH